MKQNQAALPLRQKPGAAQVDFGEAPFKYQGEEISFTIFSCYLSLIAMRFIFKYFLLKIRNVS